MAAQNKIIALVFVAVFGFPFYALSQKCTVKMVGIMDTIACFIKIYNTEQHPISISLNGKPKVRLKGDSSESVSYWLLADEHSLKIRVKPFVWHKTSFNIDKTGGIYDVYISR